MIPQDKLLKKALDEAQKSTYVHKVAAIIFDKKTIISIGRNFSQRSVKHHDPKFRKFPHSIHAEVDAIIKAKTDLKGKSIFVVRTNTHRELRMAKPCKKCMAYIEYVGIKRIYYTTNEGQTLMIKV